MKKIASFFCLFLLNTILHGKINVQLQNIDANTKKIIATFNLNEQELLYKNSLDFSLDSPYAQLNELKELDDPFEKYDPTTKETKLVFEQSPSFQLEIKSIIDQNVNTNLHVVYQTNQSEHPTSEIFSITFSSAQLNDQQNQQDKTPHLLTTYRKPLPSSIATQLFSTFQSWNRTLSTLVEQTKSLPIRLVLVFLLGILLSLTPCIYPMIPITVGVLQAQKSSSIIGNFTRSCAYTLGLSTTFACFGLAASITGPIYGKLLMNPIWVSVLVVLLGFLGLSMFGLYEVQLPKFLQSKKENKGNGSLVSLFLFGTASGTVASPCVSPGLILLLSIVATIGNLFLGFLLLFSFGLGLSMPLLIIGTFSSSINKMPRAGMWMVEIKKLFGIMIFAVCFYYLSNILSKTALMYLVSSALMILGLHYFISGSNASSIKMKKFSNGFGFILLCCSVINFGYTLQSQYLSTSEKEQQFWITDYQHGLQKARTEKKLIFLDFWAEYCSICKSINKKIVNSHQIRTTLQKMVPIAINGTYDEEPFQSLKKQFNIVGFPTFLIVDSATNTVLKKWNSELYQMSENDFIKELEKHLH